MENPEVLTKEQLAKRLNVAPATILAWGRAGRIPQVRLGRKTVRYVWADVLAALRAMGGCARCGAPLCAQNVGGFDRQERAYCSTCAPDHRSPEVHP